MEQLNKKYVNKFQYKVSEFGSGTKRRDYSTTKNIFQVQDFKNIQRIFLNDLRNCIEEAIREHYPISSQNKGVTLEYIPNT